MSINVYLNNNVRNFPGFRSEPYSDGSGSQMVVCEMKLFADGARLYMRLNENGTIPPELADFVDEISLITRVSGAKIQREIGVYSYKNAEAEVDLATGQVYEYVLTITGKNLNDVKELLREFKKGTIRPKDSYEGPQEGKSRLELEAELTVVKSSRDLFQSQSINAARKLANLQILVEILREADWPFCWKKTMAVQISDILGDTNKK